jgi:hypothetical protein
MMTKDALLWRLKYFLLLVALFMTTSFARPAAADSGPQAAAAAPQVQRR